MASPESIPVIDLRLLFHSDIVELARNDPHAYDLNRLSGVAPKIDRSVFNESAGSRKQTYSRIRKPSPVPRRPSPDRGDRENELIVQFLQHLFEPDKFPPPLDTELALATPPPPSVRTAAAAVNVAETSRALVVVEDHTDTEVLNAKGEVVDVAGLGSRDEPFADELRRRTEGMKTEEELLRFLAGLEGKWESPRNKQKFVDAAGFGDVFPRGWKVLLGLRRKEGVPSLYCRRYISPNGREFVTCKEVASYMVSLVGHQDVKQQTSGQDENDSPDLVESTPECAAGSSQGNVMKDKPDYLAVMPISSPSADQEKPCAFFSVVECHKCSLTFGDKETLVQHLLSFHQNDSKRKRRRLGTSIGHGVIVKDGKYICQFCYKSFSERRRYNGHVGSHVRNPGSNVDFIPEQIEDGPSGVGQEHENITKHEDLRMDVETPMEFDLMTYQGSLPLSQHEMSYVAQMEDVNDPLLELDWRLSLLDDGCEFKQCVGCGREFYHDSLSSQLQPNMIGLICPACKENT